METQIQKPKKTIYRRVLEKFFSTPAIILIGSYEGATGTPWKTGKTDFALKVSEDLLKIRLVHEVATNIYTYGHYPYIQDLETLKLWLDSNEKTKCFLLDEANIHLPSRRAMSNKSVDTIQIFPEISKHRARLIVIGQKLSKLDSELRTFGWVKGIFQKYDLKTVYITSPLLQQDYWLKGVSPTSIKFDPYLPAPFTLKPANPNSFQDPDLEKAWRIANGALAKDVFTHQMEYNRFTRNMLKRLLIATSQVTHISVGGRVDKTVTSSPKNDV